MGRHKGGYCCPCMRNYGPQESRRAKLKHWALASGHRFRLHLVKWQVWWKESSQCFTGGLGHYWGRLLSVYQTKKPEDREEEAWWCVEKVKGSTMVMVSSIENRWLQSAPVGTPVLSCPTPSTIWLNCSWTNLRRMHCGKTLAVPGSELQTLFVCFVIPNVYQ